MKTRAAKTMSDRLAEIKAFAATHGYSALTGSDALWLIDEVERLRGLVAGAFDAIRPPDHPQGAKALHALSVLSGAPGLRDRRNF